MANSIPKKSLSDKPFAVVPRDVLYDNNLTRPARLLFALICSYADESGKCQLSNARLGKEIDTCTRSIQLYMNELERAGRVTRWVDSGKSARIHVIRFASEVAAAKLTNLKRLIARKNNCAPKKKRVEFATDRMAPVRRSSWRSFGDLIGTFGKRR